MFPKLFTIPKILGLGPVTVHTYGVLIAIAFLVALWVISRQAAKAGLDRTRVIDLGVYTLIAGLVGGKLMLLITDWRTYAANPRELLSLLQSAGVFYGGFILALAVAIFYIRRARLPLWPTLDVMAPGVAIGQSIGRLGCLAAGCCHGRQCDLPWAVTFRDPWAARHLGTPIDIPLHPTQVYESLATLCIFLILIWTASRKRFHGQTILLYATLYAVARFIIEFFRGDASRGWVLGGLLSTSQAIAIVVLIAVAVLLPYLWKRRRVKPAAA
jgi:phosphatidylglycerol:prolipoprotein diacylglycerol transferase